DVLAGFFTQFLRALANVGGRLADVADPGRFGEDDLFVGVFGEVAGRTDDLPAFVAGVEDRGDGEADGGKDDRGAGEAADGLHGDREDLPTGQRLALEIAGGKRFRPHLLGSPVRLVDLVRVVCHVQVAVGQRAVYSKGGAPRMPHSRRLVTYLTTCVVVPLAVLITLAFLGASAGGETVRQGALQVSFGGSVSPSSLPRTGTTPVAVTIRGHVRALAGGPPPSLRRIAIQVNRVRVPGPGRGPTRRAAKEPQADRDRSESGRRPRPRRPADLPAGTTARLEHRRRAGRLRRGAGRRRAGRRRARPPRTGTDAVRRSRRRLQRPAARRAPGDPRPPLHQPAGAVDLRPRLRPRSRPRHLRHPAGRHRPGPHAPDRPHHLLRPAPRPRLLRRGPAARLHQRRLPGAGRLSQRHLS